MKFLNGSVESINAAALLLGAAGLFSRVLGILRDRMLAERFGAGRELDIYYAAFQIPDFMVAVFILGAGSAAILPIFQDYLSRDKEEARNLISALTRFFLAGSVVSAGFAFLFAPWFVELMVPGFSVEERVTVTLLTRIMLLSPVFFGLSGIFSSVVQSFHRFLAYAIAPLLYNLGIIIGIAFLVPVWGVKALAFGVVLGSLMHLGIMLVTVRELGFAPRFLFRPRVGGGVARVIKTSFPRVISLSLAQLTGMILIALGSTLAAGSVSIFQLAQNLYFLPIGIFGVSYSVAVFPRLSRAYLLQDGRAFYRDFFSAVRSVLFWMAPVSVLFLVLRAHIVRVALGAGEFSWEDTRLTAAVLAVLVFSMFAYALISLLIKGFYALNSTRTPLLINIFALTVSVLLAFGFVKTLSLPSGFKELITLGVRLQDLPDVRVLGIALGFTAGVVINFFLLFFRLLRLSQERFGYEEKFEIRPVLKIIFAALLAGLAAYFIRVSFAQTLPLITFLQVLLQGALAGAVGLVVYSVTLFLLKEEEIYVLWRTIRRSIFRIGILPQSWDSELP